MLDLNKAIVTVDTSSETLAAFDRRVRYSNATPEERRRMADEEQQEWNKKYLKDILMPGEKASLSFIIRSFWIYRLKPLLYKKVF